MANGTVMAAPSTTAQISLLKNFLERIHGRRFLLCLSCEQEVLLVSWENIHGQRQEYPLKIEPRFYGFQVNHESLKGLEVAVKMTT